MMMAPTAIGLDQGFVLVTSTTTTFLIHLTLTVDVCVRPQRTSRRSFQTIQRRYDDKLWLISMHPTVDALGIALVFSFFFSFSIMHKSSELSNVVRGRCA